MSDVDGYLVTARTTMIMLTMIMLMYGGLLSYPLPSIPLWNIFKIFRYS